MALPSVKWICRFRKLALLLTAGLVLLALVLVLLPDPAFHEIYGRRLYPSLTALFRLLTNWTPVPLGLAIIPTLTGILLVRALARRREPLPSRLARAALMAAALWAGYVILWGANYRRPALLELLAVEVERPSDSEMVDLARDLLAWVSTYSQTEADVSGALEAVSRELELLAWEVGWPARLPNDVKRLPAGTMLRAGYAGMLFPFSLEPNIDGGLFGHSRVSVGAHELAHVAGFAAEADADLAAFIAGVRADHPFARYATALSLLARTLGSLPREERTAMTESLPQRAAADLAEARMRSKRYLRPSLAARVTAIYHRLLQRQGMTGGVADYGLAPRSAALARRYGLLPQAPPATESEPTSQPAALDPGTPPGDSSDDSSPASTPVSPPASTPATTEAEE